MPATDPPLKPFDLERWQSAQKDLLRGRAARALATYRGLSQRFPGSEKLWFELGLAAARELEFDEAGRAFQRAAECAPRDAALRGLLGQQFHLLRRRDEARRCFEAAAALEPDSTHALLSLADWQERQNDLAAAWASLERCAARHPGHPQVRCSQALLRHRRGELDQAEADLRQLIAEDPADANVRYSSRQQLAVLLEETGRSEEAMTLLLAAKSMLRQGAEITRLQQSYDAADRRRRQVLAGLTPEMVRRWQTETLADPEPRRRVAFLGGHPRSGTTLLERVLGGHPGVIAHDEPLAFSQEILEPLAPLEPVQPLTAAGLDHLAAARGCSLRQRYWKSLAREGLGPDSAGRLVLDKNPSHTMSVHLWLRLFPGVKIVIALRDPRDVILSCFFQTLQLTAVNANFLSLERTVKHYCDLMDVWLRLRDLGGFDWLETRYEDLVDGLETEGRRVTGFLGLEWDAAQALFHETTGKNAVVAPNHAAVARPVYRRAVGRWRRHAEMLDPFQARLAPYCRAFGYETAH